jgi:hypothetical protein
MIKVEPGQPVMVFSGYGRNGRISSGKIIKVGRVWITVQDDEWAWKTTRFRLDDQTDGTTNGVRDTFMTMEQYAAHQQEVEGGKFLREQGIDLAFDSSWRKRQAELADIIRAGLAVGDTPFMATSDLANALDVALVTEGARRSDAANLRHVLEQAGYVITRRETVAWKPPTTTPED